MPGFSDNSAKRLSQCHPDLQAVFNEAVATTPVDFGISCGYRGEEDQEAAFSKGVSRAHFGQSPHNFRPASPSILRAWTAESLHGSLSSTKRQRPTF